MYDKNYVVFLYTCKSHVVQDPWGRRQVPLFGCHFGKRLSVPLSKELRTTRSLLQKFHVWGEQTQIGKWQVNLTNEAVKSVKSMNLGHFQFLEQKPAPKFLDPFFVCSLEISVRKAGFNEVRVWSGNIYPTKLSNWRTFYPCASLHDFHF